jgi:hypothetical protein
VPNPSLSALAAGGRERGSERRRREAAAEAAELNSILTVRLEAAALVTLCRASVDSRRAAFALLAAVRDLHRTLQARCLG